MALESGRPWHADSRLWSQSSLDIHHWEITRISLNLVQAPGGSRSFRALDACKGPPDYLQTLSNCSFCGLRNPCRRQGFLSCRFCLRHTITSPFSSSEGWARTRSNIGNRRPSRQRTGDVRCNQLSRGTLRDVLYLKYNIYGAWKLCYSIR